MTNIHHIKPLEQIEDEAAAWVWRLDDEACTPKSRAEFQAWLKEDLRHRKAYDDLLGTWSDLDDLEVLKHQFKLDTIMGGVKAEERRRFWVSRKTVLQLGAMAAAVALFIVGAAIVQPFNVLGPEAQEEQVYQTFATAVGQQRVVTLEDGSTVELNTNTIIDVEYTSGGRLVHLKKGEAHFSVEKDITRPFIVAAGDTGVRAVGTAFNVYRAPDAPVEVIVTEGVVDLIKATPETDLVASFAAQPIEQVSVQPALPTLQASNEVPLIRLTAGQSFKVAEVAEVVVAEIVPEPVTTVPQSVIEQELSWRRGMLVFQGEPLEEVVNELSRYTEARFIIEDDGIRSRRVGGRYKTDDVDGLLSVLEQGLDIRVRRDGDSLIFLSDASAAAPD